MNDPLQPLKARFLLRCADDLGVLEGEVAGATPASDRFADVVHKLAGVAGVFGFARLSELASRLDAQLAHDRMISAPARAELIAELRKVISD